MRIHLTAVLGVSAALACCTSDKEPEGPGETPGGGNVGGTKPNIIVILVDDLGYSDIGCYGSEIETPNIDYLAKNGIRFRTFYNNARSAPTRAALLTGLYPHQVGNGALGAVAGYPNYQGYTNEKNAFIPEVLKGAGYMSIMTGKWHLGYHKGVTPAGRGFDRSLCAVAGGYYYYNDATLKDDGITPTSSKNLYLNGKEVPFNDPRLPANWYSTDMWVTKGLEFVDEAISTDKPFFWYLAHNAPHFPLQAPAATIAKYRGKYNKGFDVVRNSRFARQQQMGLFSATDKLTPRNPHVRNTAFESMNATQKDVVDHRMAIYAAVIDEVDKSIGKLLAYLKNKGVLDNTLILFMSDNGGNAETGFPGRWDGADPGAVNSLVWLGTPWADVANTPYFLYKHHGHEGGCCTPLIMSWPDGISRSQNGTIDKTNYGHVIDIMPTVIELTGATYPQQRNGVSIPPMAGTSLVPAFSGRAFNRLDPIIMEHEGNRMLRDGDWKVVQEFEPTEAPWQLYNMKSDPTEMNDLAALNPAKLAEMVAKYRQWAQWTGVEPSLQFTVGNWYTPVRDYLK